MSRAARALLRRCCAVLLLVVAVVTVVTGPAISTASAFSGEPAHVYDGLEGGGGVECWVTCSVEAEGLKWFPFAP